MTNTSIPSFDMEAAIQALREGKDLTCKNGILPPLVSLCFLIVYSDSVEG